MDSTLKDLSGHLATRDAAVIGLKAQERELRKEMRHLEDSVERLTEDGEDLEIRLEQVRVCLCLCLSLFLSFHLSPPPLTLTPSLSHSLSLSLSYHRL